MATTSKKIFAVTNIKGGTDSAVFFAAGSVVDASVFTKAQLTELHDAGAIEIRSVDEEVEVSNSLDDALKTEDEPKDEPKASTPTATPTKPVTDTKTK